MKPEAKVLNFVLQAAKHAQRAKDPRERLAAVKLEIEFTERLAALEAAPESAAPTEEPAHAEAAVAA